MTEKSDKEYAQEIRNALKALNKAIYEARTVANLEVVLKIVAPSEAQEITVCSEFDLKVYSKQFIDAAVMKNLFGGVRG